MPRKLDNRNDVSTKRKSSCTLLVRMTCEWTHVEDNHEIHDTLDELNFITFRETIIDEFEAQGRSYQVDIEES